MSREMVLIPKHKYDTVLQRKGEQPPQGEKDLTAENSTDHHVVSQGQEERLSPSQTEQNLNTLIDITVPAKYKDRAMRLLAFLPDITWDERGEQQSYRGLAS